MRLVVGAGVVCILIISAIFAWPEDAREERGNGLISGVVERVIDGDTICLEGGERIRLADIDAPPLGARDGSGRRAREFLENLCPPGRTVIVDPDDLAGRDAYGRLLAVLYVESTAGWLNVNAELLRQGYARIMLVPPTKFNPYSWLRENAGTP